VTKRFLFTVVLACLLVLAFSLSLAGCKKEEPSALDRILEEGKIVVGTSADYEPFEYVDPDTGEYTGFDIELMEKIAERLGVEVEWRDMKFDILLTTLQAGELDAIIACMTVTPERLEMADFTDPYIISKDAILVKAGSDVVSIEGADTMSHEELTAALVEALKDLKVGVQAGTIHEQWCDENLIGAGVMPETNLSRYPRADQAVSDLVAGRIDCVFLDEGVALGFSETHDVEKALTVDLEGNPGIAVTKGETKLVEKLNEIIAELREEGFIAELAGKYDLPGE